MFRLVPPAGTPIKFSALVRIVQARLSTEPEADRFRTEILRLTGARHCWLVNSGRTALTASLQVMSRLTGPQRDEVIIPAYTCFSVAASVARCNLKIRLVDIDPRTMDYDYERLMTTDLSRVLAVLGCNLFGIVSNWKKLRRIAGESKTYLVDDAAQTMGSGYDGAASGTLGDIGFFSLDRGKNLSTFSGGVLITSNDQIADQLNATVAGLPAVPLSREFGLMARLAAYSVLLRPRLYWLPDGLPFLGLGQTLFDPSFTLGRLSGLQEAAGGVLFDNLAGLNKTRIRITREVGEPLIESGNYEIGGYDSQCPPAYLRLPVLARDGAWRNRAMAELRKNGVKSTTMYPSTIRQIPGIKVHLASEQSSFPGAEQVVDRLLTLPTHPYVQDRDISMIVDCLTELQI
jgi:dTDP-4-amino-4,6-dideoxygalactose transaminase